ncbi:MAG: protein phosphatase 2C domain-containing protein [Planctomycetota bacterium]|nr:MAG: protein phosphatase 2C domain-containing protein [Planctomycetota bacterium]
MTLRCCAAQVTGLRHRRSASDGMDRVVYRSTADDEGIVAVLCDGAGSAAHGGLGAELLSQTMIEHLAQLSYSTAIAADDWRMQAEFALQRGLAQIAQHASAHQRTMREYHSTVIAICAYPSWFALYHIGDGMVVSHCAQSQPAYRRRTGASYDGPVNETYFATMPHATTYAESMVVIEPWDTLLCASDGIEQVAIDQQHQRPFPGFFDPLCRYMQTSPTVADADVADFLLRDRLQEKCDDDLSLCMIGNRHSPASHHHT